MKEYAVRVYTLVEHSLRADSEDIQKGITISRSANAKKEDVNSVMRKLERASHDILEEETDYNGIESLKKVL